MMARACCVSFDTAANIPIFCQNCRYPNHEHYCLEHNIFNRHPIIQTIVIVQKSEVIKATCTWSLQGIFWILRTSRTLVCDPDLDYGKFQNCKNADMACSLAAFSKHITLGTPFIFANLRLDNQEASKTLLACWSIEDSTCFSCLPVFNMSSNTLLEAITNRKKRVRRLSLPQEGPCFWYADNPHGSHSCQNLCSYHMQCVQAQQQAQLTKDSLSLHCLPPSPSSQTHQLIPYKSNTLLYLSSNRKPLSLEDFHTAQSFGTCLQLYPYGPSTIWNR